MLHVPPTMTLGTEIAWLCVRCCGLVVSGYVRSENSPSSCHLSYASATKLGSRWRNISSNCYWFDNELQKSSLYTENKQAVLSSEGWPSKFSTTTRPDNCYIRDFYRWPISDCHTTTNIASLISLFNCPFQPYRSRSSMFPGYSARFPRQICIGGWSSVLNAPYVIFEGVILASRHGSQFG